MKKATARDWLRAAGYLVARGFVYLIDRRDDYRMAAGKDPILPR